MNQLLTFLVVMVALALVPSLSSAEDESAWEQLQNATSGSQSTGETFDGGQTPTDTYPIGDVYTNPVTDPVPVDTGGTTDTTGGYDVDTSTGNYDTGGYDGGTSTDTTGSDAWGTSIDTTDGHDTGGYEVDTSTGNYDTGSYGEESAE